MLFYICCLHNQFNSIYITPFHTRGCLLTRGNRIALNRNLGQTTALGGQPSALSGWADRDGRSRGYCKHRDGAEKHRALLPQ